MWKTLTIVFTVAFFATLIGIEIVRAIVHKRRAARDGLGGTQDIVMWGLLLALCFVVAAIVSGAKWLIVR